jgi:hypothetical protein
VETQLSNSERPSFLWRDGRAFSSVIGSACRILGVSRMGSIWNIDVRPYGSIVHLFSYRLSCVLTLKIRPTDFDFKVVWNRYSTSISSKCQKDVAPDV